MMQEVKVALTEPEAQCLRELAQQAGIGIEEAAKRAIRYALREVASISPQSYQRLRSQMFWEHFQHLNETLRKGGGQR
jgi:hypothetical protein